MRQNLSSVTSPVIKAKITTDVNKVNNEHWGHSLQTLRTVLKNLPSRAPAPCEDFFRIQDLVIAPSSIC